MKRTRRATSNAAKKDGVRTSKKAALAT